MKEFTSFSLLFGKGYDDGMPEASLVIEIEAIHSPQTLERVRKICHNIKLLNFQNAIILQQINSYHEIL